MSTASVRTQTSAGTLKRPRVRSGSVEVRFKRLARRWKSETRYASSPVQMAMHPAYQQIIGIGPDAVPLLLRALRDDPDQWFWALNAITGQNPVPAASRGKMKAMADAWLAWGRRHGFVA